MALIACVVQMLASLLAGAYFLKLLLPEKRSSGPSDIALRAKAAHLKNTSLSKPLTEKARPTKISELVGQREGIFALKAALFGKYPQHVILCGPPGVGKTTAARLIFEEAKKSKKSGI